MTPAIRLGDQGPTEPADPGAPAARIESKRVSVGGIETRANRTRGQGPPTLLLHGWMDNADTWLAVLERLAHRGCPAIAYDQPGFGTAPPLGPGSVLDQLTDFAEDAVVRAASESGSEVVVAGNSLGGWVCLRLAERSGLPIAGVVPIGPAGIKMAPLFFTVDRLPVVAQLIGMPAPVSPQITRNVVGRLYRAVAFGDPAAVDPAVVARFTRFNAERAAIRQRIDYAKRLREELDHPFEADKIELPVTVLWGERDRLCLPAGAKELAAALPHADVRMLPGVGHTPQVEAPEAVVEAIEGLLPGAVANPRG